MFTPRAVRVEARTFETNRATLSSGGTSKLGGIILLRARAQSAFLKMIR
jgi:hypothetical protein